MADESLTVRAVHRQIAAMNLNLVEVGIRDQSSEKMFLRQWSLAELNNSIPWLRRENTIGNDIYVRAQAEVPSSLVLVDDLKIDALDQLKKQGLDPCAFVQTSTANYQAWIRLGSAPLEKEIRSQAGKALAKIFKGDPASSDWRHFGRLAGFTNRKPGRRKPDGTAPFVILSEARGVVAPGAKEFLENMKKIEAQKPDIKPLPVRINSDPVKYFQKCIEHLKQQYGPSFDASRGDWLACKWMRRTGYTREEVVFALGMASSDLLERKRGHVDDYVQRTVRKVFS